MALWIIVSVKDKGIMYAHNGIMDIHHGVMDYR